MCLRLGESEGCEGWYPEWALRREGVESMEGESVCMCVCGGGGESVCMCVLGGGVLKGEVGLILGCKVNK